MRGQSLRGVLQQPAGGGALNSEAAFHHPLRLPFQAAPIAQVKSHKLTARQQAAHILSHNIKTTNGANSRPHDGSF